MPATKQQIRQIIADNNLNSVADVYRDELIRLEVVDYIIDSTVCEVIKKQNQIVACKGMVHFGSGC